MKRLILSAATIGLLLYLMAPQWRSFESMGERRFQVLSQRPPEFLVGVCWPFSVNADGTADGLRLARDEINAGGLADHIPIRLDLRDDRLDWEKTRQITIDFAENPHMSAVIGYYDDALAIRASAILESSKLLHIVSGANSTPMTARGFEYLVRTILPSDSIARALAAISVEGGHHKFALIWEEDAYGEDLAYQYRVAMDGLDAKLVYQWSYFRERPDFRSAVNQLKATDADMIFFAGLEPWAGDFLRMARMVGVKTPIIGAFSDTPEMRARAGAAIEGSMYFEVYDLNSPRAANQAFVRKFRARYGHNPDAWAAQGYDALHILAKAVQTTHSANPLDLSYAIRFMDRWEGASGAYKFDSRGELEDRPIFLNCYRNGEPYTVRSGSPLPMWPVP